MYLRRFAELRSGKGYYTTSAAPVDDLSKGFTSSVNKVAAVKGFYWATDPDGTDQHELEVLFQRIEAAAMPAFAAMLDAKEGALPQRWPLPHDLRSAMAWWIAAQILRTTRQRARLDRLAAADGLDAPTEVGRYAKNHKHVSYVAEMIAAIAQIVFNKPWGIGFSDACLLTGDVPVAILNGQDEDDQAFAAWYDVLYLPLDPHRFLLMPGQHHLEEDSRKRVDHRLKLDGGFGLFFNDVIWAAADKLVFSDPDHDPLSDMVGKDRGPRLPAPGTGTEDSVPQYAIMYGVLNPNMTVERRWLTEHARPGDGPEDEEQDAGQVEQVHVDELERPAEDSGEEPART